MHLVIIDHSFISGCLTKITRISIGRHQMRTEFVFRVRTFRSTQRFMPLNYCLKPMLVLRVRKTMNCYLGSTWRTLELAFRMKGLSVLAMV